MMSSINAINPWNIGAMAAQSSGNNDVAGSNASDDKLEFLNLLVTQLKNQDPMNPTDSKDFVAQLATFSSLEQLIAINKAVTRLADGTDQQTAASVDRNSTNRSSSL